jgi:hypothetical protein
MTMMKHPGAFLVNVNQCCPSARQGQKAREKKKEKNMMIPSA